MKASNLDLPLWETSEEDRVRVLVDLVHLLETSAYPVSNAGMA
ncbi:hypothetical protein PSE_2758 [Pseudovibrio sp. FO-BEG1]|nr:hypothetical protein PSE_2758 [Pseudovibrio sp. FO-BEG1]